MTNKFAEHTPVREKPAYCLNVGSSFEKYDCTTMKSCSSCEVVNALLRERDELREALAKIVAAADDPDNEDPSDFIGDLDWKGIRALLVRVKP